MPLFLYLKDKHRKNMQSLKYQITKDIGKKGAPLTLVKVSKQYKQISVSYCSHRTENADSEAMWCVACTQRVCMDIDTMSLPDLSNHITGIGKYVIPFKSP